MGRFLRHSVEITTSDDVDDTVRAYEHRYHVAVHGPALFFSMPLSHQLIMTTYTAYVVCRDRQKPSIGQHDTETTAGQTQQLSIVLSATDVMWFVWHIVSVENINGWASFSTDCHFHEQKLY